MGFQYPTRLMKKKAVAGYIICKRRNKTYDISIDAVPTAKGDWLCPGCGRWLHFDMYHHSGMWQGKEIL